VPKRLLLLWICLSLVCVVSAAASEAANDERLKGVRSTEPSSRIIAGTVVTGDVDGRTMQAALEVLPRRPERIVMVDAEAAMLAHNSQLREMDGYVLLGSPVIYLRRQGATLVAAEYSGGPYLLMLAVVIWHEMAHAEGLDEPRAQEREENLWQQFVQRGIVNSAVGLTYLDELRRRRTP